MKFPPRVAIFWVLSFIAVFASLLLTPTGIGSAYTLAGVGVGAMLGCIALVFSVTDTKEEQKSLEEIMDAVRRPEKRAPMKFSAATIGLIVCACLGGFGLARMAMGAGAGALYELFLMFRPVPVFCLALVAVTVWEFCRPGEEPRFKRAADGAWKVFFPVGPIVFMDKLDGFVFPAHTWGYFLFFYMVGVLLVNFVWLPRRNEARSLKAFAEGDYPSAERYARKMEGSPWRRRGQLLGATALFYAGRTAEALAVVRDTARWKATRRESALALEALGRANMESGDAAAAEAAFEGAIQAWPEHGAAFRYFAELRLRSSDAGAAEALCKRALEADEHSASDRARDLAMLARAVGLGGYPDEVARMVAEAEESAPRSRPESAEVHYHAGCAMASVARPDEAARHFQAAAELDPAGLYGRRSAAELEAKPNPSSRITV